MQCPVCNVQLIMSEKQAVEVDYCPKCRGVWLDRGELDKIIERSTADLAARPPEPRRTEPPRDYPERDRAPRYDEEGDESDERDRYRDSRGGYHDDRGGYRKRRKGSFLADIFDFD